MRLQILVAGVLVCVLAIFWWCTRRRQETFASEPPIPMFVINLKNRPDRLRAFMDSLGENEKNLQGNLHGNLHGNSRGNLHIIEAVDGSTLDASVMDGLPPERTRGEYACSLSHLEALRRIAASRFPYGIVLEDDAELPPNYIQKIRGLIRAAPAGWSAICLGSNGTQDSRQVSPGLVELPGDLYGAQAIIYTKEAATRLVGNPPGFELPWDFAVHRALRGRVYVARPVVVKLRDADSSTQAIR